MRRILRAVLTKSYFLRIQKNSVILEEKKRIKIKFKYRKFKTIKKLINSVLIDSSFFHRERELIDFVHYVTCFDIVINFMVIISVVY